MRRSTRLLQALLAHPPGRKVHPAIPSSRAGVCGQLLWQARASVSTKPAPASLQVSHWVQELLARLSVPSQELQDLLQQPCASNANTLRWAIGKLESHAAPGQAKEAAHGLQQLRQQLEAATTATQQSQDSPMHHLLQAVAAQAERARLEHQRGEQLQQLPLYQAVAAQLRATSQGEAIQQPADIQKQLAAWVAQYQPLVAAEVLCLPDYWDHLAAALAAGPLDPAAATAAAQLQPAVELHQQRQRLLQQVVGSNKADTLQELAAMGVPRDALLPGREGGWPGLLPTQQQVVPLLARWQLLSLFERLLGWGGAALVGSGASSSSTAVTSPGAATAGAVLTAVSSPDLLLRLGAAPFIPRGVEDSPQLLEQAQAAAQQLLQAAEKMSVEQLRSSAATVGALLTAGPGVKVPAEFGPGLGTSLQALQQTLQARRLAAALSGDIPTLTILGLGELQALPAKDATALQQLATRLQRQGPLVQQQVVTGRAQLSQLTSEQQQQLAWQLHKAGPEEAMAVMDTVLAQAAAASQQQAEQVAGAAAGVQQVGLGLKLERATSRVSTAAPPSPALLAGHLDEEVEEARAALPPSSNTSNPPGSQEGPNAALAAAVQLVTQLATFLADGAGAPQLQQLSAGQLPKKWRAAADQLEKQLLHLPEQMQPSLKRLLTFEVAAGASTEQQLQQLEQLQKDMYAFLQAIDAQLTAAGAAAGAAGDGTSDWKEMAKDASVSGAELVGLVGAAGVEGAAAVLRSRQGGERGRRRGSNYSQKDAYEQLAEVHHDQSIQAYLAAEFDPSGQLELVSAPRGWRDAELWQDEGAWLDAMRPLLDAHLVAAGEEPLLDTEWQLYRDAGLLEHRAGVLAQQLADRRRGLSTFYNSRADEEFLQQRLEAGVRKGNVLYEAGQRYLAAANADKSWRFADKKRLVDRVIELAAHLEAHPPRKHLGSPFSALFQKDGAPLAPQLKPLKPKRTRGRRQQAAAAAPAAAQESSGGGKGQGQARPRSLFGVGSNAPRLPKGFVSTQQ